MDSLIKRLRDPGNSGAACKVLVLEAADALEQIETERANWKRWCEDAEQIQWNDDLEAAPKDRLLLAWLPGDEDVTVMRRDCEFWQQRYITHWALFNLPVEILGFNRDGTEDADTPPPSTGERG